jgi:hypothetical protein
MKHEHIVCTANFQSRKIELIGKGNLKWYDPRICRERGRTTLDVMMDLGTGHIRKVSLQIDGISPGLRALSKTLPKRKVMFLACSCSHSARDDGCITTQILYGGAHRSYVFRHDQVAHSYVTDWAHLSPARSHGRSDYRII